MTLYDLTQAFKRQRRLLAIAFGALLILVLLAMFRFEDGQVGWRLGPRYEAAIQIAVLPEHIDSLTVEDIGPGDLTSTTELFAEMLRSSEAAVAVGLQNGFKLRDPIDTRASVRTPVLNAKLIAPTEEQAKGGILSAYSWLEERLSEPLTVAELPTTTTTTPVAELEGTFASSITVAVHPTAQDLPPDIFLVLDGAGRELALQLSSEAGDSTRFNATLSTDMTIVARLEAAGGEVSPSVRIQPPPVPQFVTHLPVLSLSLGADAVIQVDGPTGERVWRLDATQITAEWKRGLPVPAITFDPVRQIKIVLLTPDPTPVPTGERRGPIVTLAALIVGSILILSVAITKDTWQQERDSFQYRFEPSDEEVEELAPAQPIGSVRQQRRRKLGGSGGDDPTGG